MITVDGIKTEALPGETLYAICKRLGMVKGKLSTDPLVAKIAGEVFTLNYIPVREKDCGYEREAIRRAMSESDGVVSLLRYDDASARDAYRRTVQFTVFLAVSRLWQGAVAKMSCSV